MLHPTIKVDTLRSNINHLLNRNKINIFITIIQSQSSLYILITSYCYFIFICIFIFMFILMYIIILSISFDLTTNLLKERIIPISSSLSISIYYSLIFVILNHKRLAINNDVSPHELNPLR